MKQSPTLLLFCLLAIWSCAQLDDTIDSNPSATLTFSTDTIFFDTLITSRNSITRRVRIFNPEDDAIFINRIALGSAASSSYDLIVNGREGFEINDQLLAGGDSLLILVDVTIDPMDQDLPFLVKDSIIVQWNGNQTDIKLIAHGQDAVFLRGDTLCDVTWTAERPYVIQDGVIIDQSCNLTVEAGTRVYLDNQAAIFVNGNITVDGDSGNLVVFRNTRFEPNFIEAPGQWQGFVFIPGSRDNRFSYAVIENAVNGIFSFGTNATAIRTQIDFDHTTIRHMSGAGLQLFASEVAMQNCEIYNCSSFLANAFVGGTYSFDHCTFSNEPNFFARNEPSFAFLDNFPDDPTLVAELSLEVTNSIIWGTEDEEFFLSNNGGTVLDTLVRGNIIRSELSLPGNVVIQELDELDFVSPFLFDYQLDSSSIAIDGAVNSTIADDIRGLPRVGTPDVGAYELGE